ncbi:helix-turn-helix domain-containing protein [Actinomycetospora straminea]|uniref:Helix-turn-helix domain-containing protein n=1 Tax=Actinomycetospora straminea TaxID=663607 RepID=A0ABP9F159_9PSEU|nr:helix-turn-helix domain-containing protein [Actinomycetospora straminea]MDD7934691.1 helix-turn-helix domain-containing protein [Actinomycetospora straminea]
MDPHNPDPLAAPAVLASVVEALAPDGLAVLAAPDGLDVPVRALAVHEDGVAPPAGADLWLLPGRRADAEGLPAVLAVVEAAAEAGAVAVVARGRTRAPDRAVARALTGSARTHGVAVLALAPDREWADVVGRLRAVLATAAGPPPPPGAVLGRQQDLAGLAGGLAELTGGSVMIFTPSQRLLAASRLTAADDEVRRGAVLDRAGPAEYRRRLAETGFYRRLWSDEGVVAADAVPELGARRRLAIAIRAGDENLGSIWVAEGDGPLAENTGALLREAAGVAAGRLLGRDSEDLARRRLAEELLGRLLLGEADPAAVAGHLGTTPDAPAVVAVVEPVTPGDDDGTALHRVREEALRTLAGYGRRAVATVGPRRVVLVLLEARSAAGARRDLATLTDAVATTVGVPLRVGVGGHAADLGAVAASRRTAELVVRALARRNEHGCADLDEVWASAGVVALADAARRDPHWHHGPVTALRAHDVRRGTDYTASLAAYLAAFGDVAVAARALDVHANTLRYRLARLPELAGLDLADPDQRLAAAVALLVEPAELGASDEG